MAAAKGKNAVFLNQHESGSFPRFLDAWLRRKGYRRRTSSVDGEADTAAIEANRRTYGVAWPSLSFKDAKLIVSFGADFLEGWGASVPQQLDFADARAKLDGAPRFIYIGARRSLTGLNADEWLACKPGSELAIANALAGKGSVDQAAGKVSRACRAADPGADRRARRQQAGARALRVSGENALETALAVAAINQATRRSRLTPPSLRLHTRPSRSRRLDRCSMRSSGWPVARSASRSCAERTRHTRCPRPRTSPTRLRKFQ